MKFIKEKSNKVGNNIIAENANWSFEGDVANSFDDHVSNSVPLYNEGHWLIKNLSDFFLKKDSVCYDIGCSTGGVFTQILKTSNGKKAKLIGIDPVSNMIDKAKVLVDQPLEVPIYRQDRMPIIGSRGADTCRHKVSRVKQHDILRNSYFTNES